MCDVLRSDFILSFKQNMLNTHQDIQKFTFFFHRFKNVMLIKQIVMKTIVTNSIFKCIIPYSKLGKF